MKHSLTLAVALSLVTGLSVANACQAHEHKEHEHKEHKEHDHDEHKEHKEHKEHDHDEHGSHDHGAHVHGIAQLNMVLENNTLLVEFHSPNWNLIGFEHEPTTAEEQAKFDTLAQTLRAPEQLLSLSAQAGCELDTTTTEHQSAEAAFKDTQVTWHYQCQAPNALTAFETELFKRFPSIETLSVTYLSDTVQRAIDLEAEAASGPISLN